MDKFSYINNANAAFIDDLYQKYNQDTSLVDVSWHTKARDYQKRLKLFTQEI